MVKGRPVKSRRPESLPSCFATATKPSHERNCDGSPSSSFLVGKANAPAAYCLTYLPASAVASWTVPVLT